MNIDLSAEDRAFRDEVRRFLDDHLTAELRAAEARNAATFCDVAAIAQWHDTLFRRGWVAPDWPAEFGGPGWTVVQRYIFERECARAGAPRTFTFGLGMCGPVIMKYGTPEQKAFYLPRILSGEHRWCQGYSEPGSGSDLASLTTRAEVEGDHYRVNGVKIWTTFAHHASHMFCLVRTDPASKPQRGISFLLIDLDSPGITIQPIVNLAGDHEFNQVFFDDVPVPRANRIGLENDGWAVAKYLLEFERGGQYAAGIFARLNDVRRLADVSGDCDASLRTRIAALEIEAAALEITELRVMSALSTGQSSGRDSSVLKVLGSELVQRVDELAIEALGVYAQPFQPVRDGLQTNEPPIGPHEGVAATKRYLYDRAITIYGGTSEIQRNILARSVLSL